MLDPTTGYLLGRADHTQNTAICNAIRPFGRFLADQGHRSLPKSAGAWQRLLIEFFEWYLRTPTYRSSLETRTYGWTSEVAPWLRSLIESRVIPPTLFVPKSSMPRNLFDQSKPSRPELLGEHPVRATPDSHVVTKTLAGPLYLGTDQQYLADLEALLVGRNTALARVLDDYWLRLVRDYRSGRRLIRTIPLADIARRVAQDDWTIRLETRAPGRMGRTSYCVTSPRVASAGAWVVALVHHSLTSGTHISCLHTSALRRNRALRIAFTGPRDDSCFSQLRSLSALSDSQWNDLNRPWLALRFAGVLSGLDMAVACAVLLQEHPNLNPMSLSHAKLLDVRGKSYVIFPDVESRLVFSVDKPRAGTRKYAVLSPRAARVLRHVIRSTAATRALLRRSGAPAWRFLFIGQSGHGKGSRLGTPSIEASLLTSPAVTSLALLYPELAEHGLVQGTLTFSNVRSTQGVIEWLRTGSIRAVARKLGNSTKVVLENYLPLPLIRLLNERTIRRFQELVIVLAMRDEPDLLAVSAFTTIEELHRFIEQCLTDFPRGRSPLTTVLHDSAPTLLSGLAAVQANPAQMLPRSLLTVRLSASSLAALYRYRHVATAALTREELATVAPGCIASPGELCNLATLLHHAAENDEIGTALSECLDRGRLKQVHESVSSLNLFHGDVDTATSIFSRWDAD